MNEIKSQKLQISNIINKQIQKMTRGICLRAFLIAILTFTLNAQIQHYKSTSLSPDNVCTFHIADRLFSLIYIHTDEPYEIDIDADEKILFNFCHSFVPFQCITDELKTNTTLDQPEKQADPNLQLLEAFAFHVKKHVQELKNQTTNSTKYITKYTCTPYTSNSYLNYFSKDYIKHNDQPELILNLSTADKTKATEFHIFCSAQNYFKLDSYKFSSDKNKLIINGQSSYGCPVFQISGLWTALEENSLILGIILFVLGFQLLFYGLLMINVTVFVTGYFISFAILGGIFTVFLGPNSSSIAVYFSLLFILLSSTMIAYGLTKLINVSIFFIGAFFGLIVGALVNTIFSSVFSIHSVWSLVVFQILFTIPFGLLTFKYSDQVIIMSTSLTGSYLIIRPISWLIGGFPNEFVLYHMYETQELSSVPWSFYLYLLLIIVHAIMGGFYQYLKLQRQDPNNTIFTNIVTENIEQPLDKIKNTVDKLIARYSSSDGGQERYKKMKQMEYQSDNLQDFPHATQYGHIQASKQRKSQQKQKKSQQDQRKINQKQRKSNQKIARNSKDDQFF